MEALMYRQKFFFTFLCFFVLSSCSKNSANFSIDEKIIVTYPFSDPSPIPILASDKRLYPYHKFLGYSDTSEKKKWKVVTMENEFVEIYILPDVGGKVWGAVDKSNNQ